MKNISISKRISLGILVPIIGLFIITKQHAFNGYHEYQESKFMYRISDVVNELLTVVHNMQFERGTSADFVGSKLNALPAEVLNARKSTDVEIDKLRDQVSHLDSAGHEKIVSHLNSLVNELNDIKKFRSQIDAKSVKVGDVSTYYSKVIDHLFSVGFESAGLSNNPTVALEFTAMLDLSAAKDLASNERDIVSGFLNLGSMNNAQSQTVQALIAPQGIVVGNFIKHVPDLHKTEYARLLGTFNLAELQSLRDKILNNSEDFSTADISATGWFAASTDRITKLRELETLVGKNIHIFIGETLESQFNDLLFELSLALAILLVACFVGYIVARSITRPMSALQGNMELLSKGEVEFETEGTEQKNELGFMALALESFKGAEIQKRELEAAAAAEFKARQEEKARAEVEKEKQDAAYCEAVEILGAGLERFSSGDFEQPIESEFPEVLASLRDYYNDTRGHLADTLSKVRATGNSLLGEAEDLRGSSSELAKRTEAQAAALEETSAALTQIATNVKESTKRAEEASSNITSARKNSESTDKVVSNTIDAMKQIEKTSGEIASIISVIDDIAFQTNLLALNAGVEAARAGEAGKGFAVVAQEVRELAQRSASAAKEIEALIKSSGSEVNNGVKLVKEAGEALSEIVKDVSDIDEHMQNISQAANEQSTGLDQISSAVLEMDQATQKNSAMVNHTNEITQRVAGGSHLLHDLMANFKTRDIQALREMRNRGQDVVQDIENLKDEELPPQQVAV